MRNRLPIQVRMRIKRLERSFVRDRWGSLTNCYWNKITKEEIIKLESNGSERDSN